MILYSLLFMCHFYTHISYIQISNVSFYKNFINVHRREQKGDTSTYGQRKTFAFVTSPYSLLD